MRYKSRIKMFRYDAKYEQSLFGRVAIVRAKMIKRGKAYGLEAKLAIVLRKIFRSLLLLLRRVFRWVKNCKEVNLV